MLSGTPNVEFQDLGDFYMAGEERIPLLRAVNELVVTLKADVIPSTSVGSIVVTEAALADFQPTERVYGRHSTIRIDSKSSGLSANMMNAKQSLAAHSEVAWAGEVFVSARTGRWIIPNNEVIVSLDNGIGPEDVFGDLDSPSGGELFELHEASGGDDNDLQLERRKCPTIVSNDCRRVYSLAI
jgi:hypothetical protein